MDAKLEQILVEGKAFLVVMEEKDGVAAVYIVPSCFRWLYENYKLAHSVDFLGKEVMIGMGRLSVTGCIQEFAKFADQYMTAEEKRAMNEQGFKTVLDTIGVYVETNVWGWRMPRYGSWVSNN